MTNIKNFLMMGLLPLFGLALLASCEKDPQTDNGNDPQRPSTEKDSTIVLAQKVVTAAVSGESCLLAYEIVNPHQGEKISAVAAEDWVSDFNTSITGALGFKVAANTGDKARETLVTVSYHYAEDVTFTVKQGARSAAGFSVEQVTGYNEYFSFTLNVTPEDKTLPYIVMSASPAYIAEYGLDTSEKLYQDDYDYFEYLGKFHGMTATEVMQDRALVGDGDGRGRTVGQATPGDTYIVYCYYFDYDSGALLSEVERFPITVEHPQVQSLAEGYFTFKTDIVGPRVFAEVTSSTDTHYYFDVMTENELNTAVSNGYTKESYIQHWWATIVANLKHKDGYSCQDILYQNTCQGPNDKNEPRSKWTYDLLAKSKYYLFAFNMDESALCVTTPHLYEFTTGEVEPSDNQISLAVSDVTSYRATVKIDAKYEKSEENYRHAYVVDVATLEDWNKFGDSDEARMKHIAANIPLEYMWGDVTVGFTNLKAETDYVVYAFGLYGGVVTTQLWTDSFKTKSDAPGEVDINVVDNGYYNPQDLALEPGFEFFADDSYAGKAIYPIEIEFTEKNHGDFFLEVYDWSCLACKGVGCVNCVNTGKRFDLYNDSQYISGLLWQIEDKGSYKGNNTYSILNMDSYYTIVAIVVDVNGQYSKLFKRDVHPVYDGAGDAADFIEWWYSWNEGGSGDGPGLSSIVVDETAAEAKANYIEIDASVAKTNIKGSYLKASEREFNFEVATPEVDAITATR